MKKGFTLIELLAVIVILAIIALIAIPTITNIVEEARKGAAESSALGYIDAVEKYIMLHDVDSNKYPYDLRGKTLNVAKNTDISLLDIFVSRVYAESAIPSLNEIINPKGKKPTSGTIVVNEKGKVSNYAIIINKYKVKPKKDSNDNLIIEKPVARKMGPIIVKYHANGGTGEMADTKDIVATNEFTAPVDMLFKEWNTKADGTGEVYTSETPLDDDIDLYAIWEDRKPEKIAALSNETHKGIVYMDPTNLKRECNASNSVSTTGTKTGCMKFYIYDDSGDTYKMILDHNTTAGVAWNSSGNNAGGMNEVANALSRDTQRWAQGLSPRLITAYEIKTITHATKFNGSKSTWLYLDGSGEYKQTRVSTTQGQSPYAWLFDYIIGCTDYGCNIEDRGTFGYWTSSPVTDDSARAWDVSCYGTLNDNSASYTGSGVRPVIELPKSSIIG